jgi:hypothetical protein
VRNEKKKKNVWSRKKAFIFDKAKTTLNDSCNFRGVQTNGRCPLSINL